MTTLNPPAIADPFAEHNAGVLRARLDYYAHLNTIERHDPSQCREGGCTAQRRGGNSTRCHEHAYAERDRRRAYDRERQNRIRNTISEEQVVTALRLRGDGLLWREIARGFGVTSSALIMACGRAGGKAS